MQRLYKRSATIGPEIAATVARVKPLTEKALAAMAALAVEYRTYKDVPRCVRYDIDRLTSLGFVREHGGKVLADVP